MNPADIARLMGSEYAQHDANFLSYAVNRPELLEALNDASLRPFLIINAARGSGKSGLLLSLEKEISTRSRTTNIVIRKYFNDLTFAPDDLGPERSITWWKHKIYEWIICEIGCGIEVPVTDEELFAVELAETEGARPAPPKRASGSHTRLQPSEGLFRRIVDSSPKKFWLLLDEMDDVYSNTKAVNHRLLGLLQACQFLRERHQNVFIRLTIRPHIMTILRTEFDVIQKLRASVLTIDWTEEQLREILVRRILRFDNANISQHEFALDPPNFEESQAEKQRRIIGKYFSDFDASFTEDRGTNYRVLQTFSLKRPRWMIEFCILALEEAKGDFVNIRDFKKALNRYGANRIDFLTGEHRAHIPDLARMINGIASARRSVFGGVGELRRIILHSCLGHSIEDLGEPTRDLDIEALRIAGCLYMTEIIRPKQKLGGGGKHRFVTYLERPTTLASWNSDPKFIWEMHPTFARTLNIIDSNTYRVGNEVRALGDKKT